MTVKAARDLRVESEGSGSDGVRRGRVNEFGRAGIDALSDERLEPRNPDASLSVRCDLSGLQRLRPEFHRSCSVGEG